LVFISNIIRKNQITGKLVYASSKIPDYFSESNQTQEVDVDTKQLMEILGNKYLLKNDLNPIAKAYYQALSSQKIETLDFQPLKDGLPESIWIAVPVLPQKGQMAFLPVEDDEVDDSQDPPISRISGILIAQIIPDQMNKILQMDSEQNIYLVGQNSQGETVFHSHGTSTKTGTKILEYLNQAMENKGSILSLENLSGMTQLVTSLPVIVFDKNWTLITEVDESNAFSAIYKLMLWIGGIGLMGLTLIVIIVWLTTRMIVGPIIKVVEFAHKLKAGNLSVKLKEGKDEIGEMATALNNVVDELKVKTDVARKIAEGDLCIEVHVASDEDELGRALQNMINSLNKMVHSIMDNAQKLSGSAQKFSTVAEQVVDSSAGITIQTESVTSAVVEISHTISSMAAGAEESSANIQSVVTSSTQMSQNTDQISQTVVDMTKSIQNVIERASNASEIAGKAHEMSTAATETIEELDSSAAEINEVTEIITMKKPPA